MRIVSRTLVLFNPENNFAVVKMPQAATVLKLGIHDEALYLWHEADPTKPAEKRYFRGVLSGEPVPEPGTYVDSVEAESKAGRIVYHHIYEVPFEHFRAAIQGKGSRIVA